MRNTLVQPVIWLHDIVYTLCPEILWSIVSQNINTFPVKFSKFHDNLKCLPLFYQVLAFSIRKSDMDLRKTLYSNIVLSGGSTLYRGNLSVAILYLWCILVRVCSTVWLQDLETDYWQRSRN